MRRALVFLSIPALVLSVGCSSGSRAAAPAPVITSITGAPGHGWTTARAQTPAVAVTPRSVAPEPPTWPQPPVMEPPVMEAPMFEDVTPAPGFDAPAEPTWTAPAPMDAPAPLPDGMPAPLPEDMPAPLPDEMPAPMEAPTPSEVGNALGFDKPGFRTFERDGRLWVFREGSEDLATFLEHGEPAKSVTSIGSGPSGMTLRSGDMDTIQAYLAGE